MKIQAGFYKYDNDNLVNTQNDISINSCGRYELINQKQFQTYRPNGREDFQLLYVARGKAFFNFRGELHEVNEGTMVIYLPGESQEYGYNLQDSPVVYWLHFSGYNVYSILKENNLSNSNIFFVGVNSVLPLIFDKIIKELHLAQTNYFEICNLFIKELLMLSSRFLTEIASASYSHNKILSEAIDYFNENSNLPIMIKQYANKYNISYCWFIRSFKNYTGSTPNQYITNIRINKAKSLLETGSFTISEVSNLVGYDNPLYFSRTFKKNVGISPKGYCQHRKNK